MIRTLLALLALALTAPDSSLARDVERRLALYEQARPYRDE